jgi:hypothetical protein
MNTNMTGSKRPKLYLPKALLAAGMSERRAPNLSRPELRTIVIELLG